jgi:hypothetical protein
VELEAIITYRSSSARFKIQNENEGIFTANLLNFDGDCTSAPAQKITLVKGIRYWTGSIDDEILLSELGKFIDLNWTTAAKNI